MAIFEGMKTFGPLFIRLGLGPLFFVHGSQKLFGWFGGKGLEGFVGFFESLGLAPGKIFVAFAGGAEFLGGILVLLGLWTRFGALLISGVMVTAIALVHWPKFIGEMEFPLALLCMAISLLFTGPGSLSFSGSIKGSN